MRIEKRNMEFAAVEEREPSVVAKEVSVRAMRVGFDRG